MNCTVRGLASILASLLMSLAASHAGAAVTALGTASSTSNANTLSFTVPAGTNRVLIVVASHGDSGGLNFTAASFGASSMALAGFKSDGAYAVDSFWYLALGTSGSPTTATITVTPPSGEEPAHFLAALAFSNVDQTTPTSGFTSTSNGAGGSNPSITVPSAAGDMVVDVEDMVNFSTVITRTPGSGQTAAATANVTISMPPSTYSDIGNWGVSTKAGAASTTMSWTATYAAMIQAGLNIRQAAGSAPTVTTPTNTSITSSGATLGGNATADGGSAITVRGVVYSVTTTNNNPQIGGSGVTDVTAGSGTGVFTTAVTGLSSATGYSFKAYATNSIGTTYTSVTTFTTSAVAPTLTTPTNTSITASGATLGGNATADGGSAITVRGVVYSVTTTNNNPQIGGSGVTNVTAGSGTGVFTTAVTGLSSATGYSFKAYATNAIGTTYTSVATFTTSAVAPTVTTPTNTSITGSGATLGGNATADGGSAITVRGVVYSVTTTNNNPQISGSGVTNVTAGSGTGVFTTAVTGLSSSTGYSFKAYATNAIGTTYTSVSTFTTSAVAPTVTTPTSASITASGATLGGNATADGGSAITVRGIVYSVTTTNNNPQISGSGVTNVTAGSGTGVFTAGVTGLSSATGYSFKAYATNAIGTTYTSVATFTTSSCPTITLAALPNGIMGSSYSASATASGGTGPYSYAITTGTLPTGLTRTGADFSGSPTATGTFNFDITATDTAAPGTCTGTRSYTVVIGSVVNAGNLVIREFRLRGPAGIHDEYVEVANVTGTPLTIATTDGSSGFGIGGQNVGGTCPTGTTQLLAAIPNGKVIPVGGFVLLANNTPTTGYSLGNYGGANAATPDATWTNDVCDGSGLALFKSSATLDLTTRLDAVGFAGSTSPYLETIGVPVPGATGSSEVVYVRETPGGFVQDTGVNANDFYLGDTAGATFAPVTARLAAPGPQNATSQLATGITFTLADPAKGATAFPNRYRTTATATTGTYFFRWKVTNNTGAAITSLRIRVSSVTTLNSPGYVAAGAQADFRLTNSTDVAITVPAAVTALGLTVEPPPTGLAQKGGYNSSCSPAELSQTARPST